MTDAAPARPSTPAQDWHLEDPESLAYLDPRVAEEKWRERHRRRLTVETPLTRLVGCTMVVGLALLHNRVLLKDFSWVTWLSLLAAVEAYALGGWILLRGCYGRFSSKRLAQILLLTDIGLWNVVIYYTGGERSWLVWPLMVPVGEQIFSSFRQALLFGHLSTASYAVQLGYLAIVEDRPDVWPAALAKVLVVYGGNLFVATVARGAARYRRQRGEAIRMGRELIRQLDETRRHLEEASRAKSRFLANMSHEIRTPLNAIIGMTRLGLAAGSLEETQRCLRVAASAAGSLLGQVNHVLDFSKIEAGKLEIASRPVALRPWLSELLDQAAEPARAKGLAFAHEVEDDVPAVIVTDADRLGEVVLNLVDNAVKFTSQGEIRFRVALEGHPSAPAESARLFCEVKDTGIGIPADRQVAIFKAFEQADGSHARLYGGTGLGLAIAANLVRLMGGRMWVESTEGHGCAFRFVVPVAATDATAIDPAPPLLSASYALQRHGRPLRILVVEDDPVNQEVAAATLERWGHSVHRAANGQEALEALEAQPIDLVMMDLRLPGMDGYALTAAILARRPALPIVAVTADATTEDQERCLAAGMSGYLTKPLDAETLFDLVERWAGTTAGKAADGAANARTMLESQIIRRVGGDPSRAHHVSRLYLETAPTLMTEVDSALTGADTAGLASALHRLKGASSNFDTGLAAGLDDLEDLARSGGLAAARARWPSVRRQVMELGARLSALCGAEGDDPSGATPASS